MTNKEIVQDLLRRIPDDASLQDIAQELEFYSCGPTRIGGAWQGR